MTAKRYAAGFIILVILAVGGHGLSGNLSRLWVDCEASPDADCLLGEAEVTLAAVENPAARAFILVTVGAAWTQRGEEGRAAVLYKAAEEAVEAMGDYRRQNRIRENMAVTAAQNGDKIRARRYFQQVIEADLSADILTDMQRNMVNNTLSLQASVGDVEGALENVARMRTRLWRAEALLFIAEQVAMSGTREQLAAIVPKALKAADAVAGVESRRKLMLQMPRLLAASGDIETARVMADGLEDEVEHSNAWAAIVEVQAKAGNLAGALESYKQIEYLESRDMALWWIAVAQAEDGDFEGAAKSLGLISDRLIKGQALGDVAAIHAAAGRPDMAMEIAESLDAGYVRYRAWRQIANALAESGDLARAVEAAGKIEKDGQRKSVLLSIALKLAHNGLIGEAVKFLELIEQPASRDSVSAAIAYVQAHAGKSKQAIATARAIESPHSRAGALTAVALAMMGDVE
jgi:tetratricopeptide (TPR) repeat protein